MRSAKADPPQGFHQDYARESRSSYHQEASSDGHVESTDLRFLLYLTLGFGVIEIIMIYGKYDFLNVNFLLN